VTKGSRQNRCVTSGEALAPLAGWWPCQPIQAARFTAFVGRRGITDDLLSGGLSIAFVGSVVWIVAGSLALSGGLLLGGVFARLAGFVRGATLWQSLAPL
jgi:hypothetical protein